MRRLAAAVALFVGIVFGYSATIALSRPATIPPSATPMPGPTDPETPPADTTPQTTRPVESIPSTTNSPGETTYLVWATGGLPLELVDGLVAGFGQVSAVRGGVVELDAPGNAVIPLDAFALDPDSHRPFDPAGHLAALRPGTIVLSDTSARLREAAVGDLMSVDESPYEVVAIVPDVTVAGAEAVFADTDPDQTLHTVRYVLIRSESPRPEFEATVRSMYDGPAPIRIRAEGETPWLRHGDAVLPQVFIKQELGEFSYANRNADTFDQDPTFADEWIVTSQVPILGEVICHRVVTDMLIGAMTQLVDEGLAHLVDPAGFGGCWNPRFTRTVTGTSAGLSRHSWGAAVDINSSTNPFGSSGTQDPRLVAVMQEWGFTWGGEWLVPDPMHFEFVHRPQPGPELPPGGDAVTDPPGRAVPRRQPGRHVAVEQAYVGPRVGPPHHDDPPGSAVGSRSRQNSPGGIAVTPALYDAAP